jgi:hypothetical protein
MVEALPLSAACKAVPQTVGEPVQVTVHSWQTPATQSWVAEQLHDGGDGGGFGGGQVTHQHSVQHHQSLLFRTVQLHCLPHRGDRISDQLPVTLSQTNDNQD